ncbi:hypothetical protein DXG01_016795, partial [Tephrocybe rancida]
PLDTAALDLASNVIKNAEAKLEREMLEERLNQGHDIVLLLARGTHVGKEEDNIMTTEQSHECSIVKELGAGLRAALIRSSEARLAPIQDGIWHMEAALDAIFLIVLIDLCLLRRRLAGSQRIH